MDSRFSPTRWLSRCARRPLPGLLLAVVLVLGALVPATASAAVTTTAGERLTAARVAAGRVGAPYRAGGQGPYAFDCSGLVVYAYARARAPLGVRTSFQMWHIGVKVARSSLRVGDLVFTWQANRSHVGIVVSGGRYVHAPGPGRRVEVAPIPAGKGFIGAVRP